MLTVCDALKQQQIHPALVMGMPIGFSHAPLAKRQLMHLGIPFITIEGAIGADYWQLLPSMSWQSRSLRSLIAPVIWVRRKKIQRSPFRADRLIPEQMQMLKLTSNDRGDFYGEKI